MSDFCENFIILASVHNLGVKFIDDNGEKNVDGLDVLLEFINSDKQVIYSSLDDRKRIVFNNTINADDHEKIVIFSKSESGPLTEENLQRNMQISSFSGPISLVLYQQLNAVFTPLLKQDKIKRHIANLQADLRTEIINTNTKFSELVIENLEHEVEYWENLSNTSTKRLIIASSANFVKILKPLSKEFAFIDTLPINEVEELLENAHSVLDDLWRSDSPFPKDRMKHVMNLIGFEISRCIDKHLANFDIWTENYSVVAELIMESLNLVDKWLGTCKQLTQIFWPNYSNIWDEGLYQPEELLQVKERLEEILNVQTLHRQLVRLLSPQEQESLNTNTMFKPFKTLSIFEFGKFSNTLWIKARKEFERLLQPAEEKVAIKLKKQLSSIDSNTRQLLHEFSRYMELISRPILKQALLVERQFLLTSLLDYVRQLQQQEPTLSTKYETPQVVEDVIIARQLEAKLQEVQKTSQKLLDDLQGFDNLDQVVSELLKDVKQQHTELFDTWVGEINNQLKDLTLKESDPVVAFSDDKLMKVNYAPRLVILISEVRQFKALGYHVPNNIEQVTEHARKFMQLARVLEKIANFHNTIGDRMIPCQRPMMLQSALALSKLVKEQEVVSWNNTKSVEKYVDTLQKAVEKLSKENNLLTSFHNQILEKMAILEDTDLIKDYSRWKDISRQLRNIVTQVEEKGFKNLQKWKSEIDQKLGEVLKKQYLKSLDSLHIYLPEIYADIVYRNSKLEFQPSEKQLGEKYEMQLKRFLDIPKNFTGVCETNFGAILERSQDSIEKVHKHTDDLLQQLQGVLKHWTSWLQLENLDTSKLTTWQHWDLHFRASKTFGQEIAKLPSNEERVGCFLIGLSRLRSDLELHNRSYWDQLVESLKDSLVDDVVKLQNYIDPATATLTKQPLTIEEVGESGAAHANIIRQAPEMEACFNEMMKKSQILSSWSREQVDSVNRLRGAWERLQSLLENHQHIIAKQMETIKTTLNIENENFVRDLERFNAKWEQIKPKPFSGQIVDNSMDDLFKQLQVIKEKKEQWKDMLDKRDKLLDDYDRFNIEKPIFSLIEEIERDLEAVEHSWELFEEFHKELSDLCTEEWIVFRKKSYKFGEFVQNWQAKLKEPSSDLVTRILKELQNYEAIVPVLRFVKGDDFTDKHWMEVHNILGIPSKPIDQLILKDFLDVSDNLVNYSKELQAICKKAASEIVVRHALAELDQWDIQAKFVLTQHYDSHGKTIMLVKDFKDILNKIGDNQSLLQSIKNSTDYDSFTERSNLWESKLVTLDQNLSSLAQIQRKWVYLEPIFGGGTLIQEKPRFDKVDKELHHILVYIERDPRVSSLYRYQNLSSILHNLQDQLTRCQRSLDNFLAEKRNKFPRFLFLSDDDLLEVIGQSAKEQVIQTHLKKLFAGINSIQMEGVKIVAMCSLQGEVVPLSTPVDLTDNVEQWLNDLVKQMQKTLKELLVECLSEHTMDPLKYPSQILCLADNINFTLKTEQAISNMTLPPLLAYYKTQLSHLTINQDGDFNVLDLKLKSLLLDTIHHIQTLEELMENNTTKTTDWQWQKQLRFYSNSTGEVTVKMANARMDYAYEYLGNAAKLVRTSLTDRCFLTLTQSIHLGMGGNPYGPAGTGKTESVKALGALLGRQVLVFNCDGGIDASQMGRILSGLVQSGAWGCFDEFNRLDEATLSAVSMQIQPIQTALRTHKDKLVLLDQEIKVNKHCGIFVTLNPAGGNYGGRNKLPDNLKQLFRPVLMTQPENEQIARTLLHCDGYTKADTIARKLIETFEVSEKLLSKQQHYDWGLRSIRTVLIGSGSAIKSYRKSGEPFDELNLVAKILKINTTSKLTYSDRIKFDGIIKDVFGAVIDFENHELVKVLEQVCHELNLVVNKKQIQKCLELYEQIKQRMGVTIVGPSSCGKTTIRKLLFQALGKMGRTLKQHVFNPKSVMKTELLGQIDLDTRQWNDGVLTIYSLQVTSEPLDVWSWIVCDGNIDPEWIESLNSVMDDNRLLSLPSGWRIQFGPNVNFIFETHDLTYASPATISRMGIIFLSQEDLNPGDYIDRYVGKMQVDDDLKNAIKEEVLKCVNWIVDEGELAIPRSRVAIASTGLSQLDDVKNQTHLAVALISGLSQQLQDDFREIFCQQVFEWLQITPPPLITRAKYNVERDIVDYHYTNPDISIKSTNPLPLVLTGQINQILDILEIWLKKKQHFLIAGSHGSAKTLILEHIIKERFEKIDLATIYCSKNLTTTFVINKVSQFCIAVNTNKGKILKPKKGQLVVHFKNLQLLKCDKWGTNNLIEFLHQVITYNAFFDHNLERVGIENIIIVATLTCTAALSTRFTSIVHLCSINPPDQEDLSIITVAYLAALLNKCGTIWPKAKIVKLAGTLISFYDKLRSTFTINQCKLYTFSPHDLMNWCESILRYKDLNLNEYILEILYNEALKQFGVRLVNEQDRNTFSRILNESFNSWGSFNQIHGFYAPLGKNSLTKLKLEDWISMIKKGVQIYERDGQYLDLLMNDEVIELTSSLLRVLSYPGGNAVLVGRAGIGRKNALKIVSALQSAKLIRLVNKQFNNDLKNALQSAGVDGEEAYLLLEDHILDENSLSVINCLMFSGEVPGLYNAAELENLSTGLKDEAIRDNFEGNLVQYFSERVLKHLHVIACIDVDNENIWNIFESCPAFLHKSNIIWNTEWSLESIRNVPQMMITECKEKNIEICTKFQELFDVVKDRIRSPFRYMTMIKLYISIYSEKKSEILAQQVKLKAGVSKLNDAANLVVQLKEKAAEKQEKLAEKQAKANSALDMISNTMRNANTHKEEMESLKMKTEKENQQLVVRKKEIEAELSEVEPLIEQARSAVGNIKTESLSEIRSLRAPPDIIRDLLEGVLRLMGIQDTSWNSMKIFLAKRGVKEEIKTFDASRITQENRQAVERLIANKSDSFDSKASKRASVAAAPLAAWVIANVKYSHVLDKIKPLEREQNKLKQNLASAEAQLYQLSAGLSDVDATVLELKNQLAAFTKEAAEIEIDLNKSEETLSAAEGLVAKLDDEYQRWQQQLKELLVEIEKLPLNCALAAAFITYLSSEFEDERKKTLDEWKQVVGFDEFSFEKFLSSEREQLQWQSDGLSHDNLSLQNAIIILKTKITPLLIDPTLNATKWIKNHFKQPIENCTQSSPKFETNLELAVRFGKILIIEEVDDISPCLLPILRKEFYYQGERKLVNLNGKLIDYNNDFMLILSTRNEKFRIKSEMSAIVSVMNFTITHAGLTEQLLSSAIRQENPKLEDKRKQLLRQREELQEKQHQLQNQLLGDLANSSGDILQNSNLLSSLNKTKASSIEISEALEESSRIQKKIQEESEVYYEISNFGSSMYFACNELTRFNILYVLSVSACVKLFLVALQTFQGVETTADSKKRHLFQTVYTYMSRGIFKNDRLMSAMHLVQKLFPNPQIEWSLFLGSSISRDIAEDVPSWIPKQSVIPLQNFQLALPQLYKSFDLKEQRLWNTFMTTTNCEAQIPANCKVSDFQKILLVQALRPDRTYSAMTQYILRVTGLKTVDPPVVDLDRIYTETTNEPILVLTTSGCDPSYEIRELAQSTGGVNFVEVAMGEGQEEKALEAFRSAAKEGGWLILKNLHLVTNWLTVLNQNLQNTEFNENFRLWLITEPNPLFNFVLAQNSLKIVSEAPQGIRNNLQRTYTTYKNLEIPNSAASRIFFVLASIHAILQERRNYIPQGWSKFYEFSDTDFSTCVKLVEDLWQSPRIQWKFVAGLCGDAVYGGRIESLDDMEILQSYLRLYLVDDVLSHRWSPFGLKVTLPNSTKTTDYFGVISQIPQRDLPKFFGLPDNIDRAWEKQTSIEIIQKLKNLSIHKNLSSKFDREIWAKALHPYMNLWKKLNQGHEFIRMSLVKPAGTIMEIFLGEELNRALNLIQAIHKNFTTFNKIIKCTISLEDSDLIMGNALIKHQVPVEWLKQWDGPKEPSKYLRCVISKTMKILEIQQTGSYKNLNLAHLFHPNGFLTSYKQEFSRAKNIAMDQLALESNWKRSPSENAITLTDLLMEGGIFDGFQLKQCDPDSDNIITAPNCYISWRENKLNVRDENTLSVPVFYTSNREKQFCKFQIPCDGKERDKWIQAGVAFYLEF